MYKSELQQDHLALSASALPFSHARGDDFVSTMMRAAMAMGMHGASRHRACTCLPFCLLLLFLAGCTPLRIEGSAVSNCYVAKSGAGENNGAAPEHAYAWNHGGGLKRCLEQIKDGGVVHIAYAEDYVLKRDIRLNFKTNKRISIVGSGKPARGGDYGRSVPSASRHWPRIIGTRSFSDFGHGGNNFIRILSGVPSIRMQRLRLERFNVVLSIGSRKQKPAPVQATLMDMEVDTVREVFSISAPKPDYDAGFSNWDVRRVHAQGVSKRFLRADGLSNSIIEDVYADTVSATGIHYKNDWPFLIHFGGASTNNVVRRFIGKNPVQETEKYGNGDCIVCEKETSHITLEKVMCFSPMDAGFDIKGRHHSVTDGAVFNYGNRAFRVWHGPVHLHNIIAGYSGLGDEVSKAPGSNAGVWNRGEAIVSNYTSLNNHAPIMVHGGSLTVKDSAYILTQGFEHMSLSPALYENGRYEEHDVRRLQNNRTKAGTHFPTDKTPQIMHGFGIAQDATKDGIGFLGFESR